MKTKTLLPLLLSATLIFSSCDKIGNYVTPSSNVTIEKKNIANYSGIQVSDAFTVYINFSDTLDRVEIKANENLHDYIVVENIDDNLTIRIKDNIDIRSGEATLTANISTKYLSRYKASGATNIILLNKLMANNIKIDLSGASSLIGSIKSNSVEADISGASMLKFSGNTNYLKVDASGASTVQDYYFTVSQLNLELSGASNAYLWVDKQIDINASGASTLLYKGNAEITNQDLSGASTIKKKK